MAQNGWPYCEVKAPSWLWTKRTQSYIICITQLPAHTAYSCSPLKNGGWRSNSPPSSGSKGAAWRFHKFFQVVLFWLVILSMKKSQVGVTLCQLEYQDILQVRSAFLRRWEWAAKLVGGLASYVPWIPVEKGGNWHGKICWRDTKLWNAWQVASNFYQFWVIYSHYLPLRWLFLTLCRCLTHSGKWQDLTVDLQPRLDPISWDNMPFEGMGHSHWRLTFSGYTQLCKRIMGNVKFCVPHVANTSGYWSDMHFLIYGHGFFWNVPRTRCISLFPLLGCLDFKA